MKGAASRGKEPGYPTAYQSDLLHWIGILQGTLQHLISLEIRSSEVGNKQLVAAEEEKGSLVQIQVVVEIDILVGFDTMAAGVLNILVDKQDVELMASVAAGQTEQVQLVEDSEAVERKDSLVEEDNMVVVVAEA